MKFKTTQKLKMTLSMKTTLKIKMAFKIKKTKKKEYNSNNENKHKMKTIPKIKITAIQKKQIEEMVENNCTKLRAHAGFIYSPCIIPPCNIFFYCPDYYMLDIFLT